MMTENSLTPLISIIIPTYNRGSFIKETIESIQKQTYPNWELIIVDDGSEDNTTEIIHNLGDQRIHYYKEVHCGMEKARNFGLSKAKGELIGFMDSDDLWASTKLEKQLKIFQQFPDVSFCLTGGYEFEKLNKPIVYYYKQNRGSIIGDLFLSFFKSELVAATSTLLFKKECLETVRMPVDLELAHIHFILGLTANFEGCILYEALHFRRIHAHNYSTVHQSKRHYDGIKLIKHYKNKIPRRIFGEILLKSHVNFGEICLKSKNRLDAIREFLQAWKYQPLNFIPAKKIAKALLRF